MKRFAAHYIFTLTQTPIKNGIVEINESGIITKIYRPVGNAQEKSATVFYNGIIVPAFVHPATHPQLLAHRYQWADWFTTPDEQQPAGQLSLTAAFSDLKRIAHENPRLPLYELLRRASMDGAVVLNLHHEIGSIELGKRPGLLLIQRIDYKNMTLKATSTLQKLA